MENALRPWISKKMLEFLSEEEPVLIDFIVGKLLKQSNPYDLCTELESILDSETESFVLKLWRMLIFNILLKE